MECWNGSKRKLIAKHSADHGSIEGIHDGIKRRSRGSVHGMYEMERGIDWEERRNETTDLWIMHSLWWLHWLSGTSIHPSRSFHRRFALISRYISHSKRRYNNYVSLRIHSLLFDTLWTVYNHFSIPYCMWFFWMSASGSFQMPLSFSLVFPMMIPMRNAMHDDKCQCTKSGEYT